MMNLNHKRIIISRTDSIGDVVLTLPLAGVIKENFPECEIIFLCQPYTIPVVRCSSFVDRIVAPRPPNGGEMPASPPFGGAGGAKEAAGGVLLTEEGCQLLSELDADVILHVFPRKEIARAAKQAKIPLRIGTNHRLFHWRTCNRMINLGRKNSKLHEAQLNLQLLKPLGLRTDYPLNEIPKFYGFEKIPPLGRALAERLDTEKINLIIHPKSKGSSREWNLKNYSELIRILPGEKFRIFLTGTEEEGSGFKKELTPDGSKIIDLSGKMNLDQFIAFISKADGLVACSTGPLHLSSALGKPTLGLFPPMRPVHPGRWAPVGLNARYLVSEKKCSTCRRKKECACLNEITPKTVVAELTGMLSQK